MYGDVSEVYKTLWECQRESIFRERKVVGSALRLFKERCPFIRW